MNKNEIPLERAQHLADIGDRQAARNLLAEILLAEPHNLRAWELMANVLDDHAKQVDCYKQMLRIDPGNQAAADQLEKLSDVPAYLPPPDVDDILKLLREVGLDALDRETLVGFEERGVTISLGEDGYISIASQGRVVKVHQSSLPSMFGNLTPELLVDRVGPPLQPDERRNCPRCDAVIPNDAKRCEWCSLAFNPDGEPIWE